VVQSGLEHCLFSIFRRISAATPAPERARLGTELQQLYAESKFTEIGPLVDACLPKDEAGNFIASQERSDVVHDSPGLPGAKNAGDEPGRSKRRSRASWAGWRATWAQRSMI